ncbi:hypothetical protein F5888DRAFT_234053 [Russula emetica]|nr:hypothetical protein F5888DRAFT_234053 [Russula emetica]
MHAFIHSDIALAGHRHLGLTMYLRNLLGSQGRCEHAGHQIVESQLPFLSSLLCVPAVLGRFSFSFSYLLHPCHPTACAFILRTSTIIFMMTILVEVLNIFAIATKEIK